MVFRKDWFDTEMIRKYKAWKREMENLEEQQQNGKKKSLTIQCIFDEDHICNVDGYYITGCKDCLDIEEGD